MLKKCTYNSAKGPVQWNRQYVRGRLVGRENLIKMSLLSKFTYLFRQTSVPIPNVFFRRLDSIFISFVWQGAIPSVVKTTLQMSITLGGLTLPCFIKYYWAAVLVTVKWWLSEELANRASTLEVALLGSYSELRNLVQQGPWSNPNMTAFMRTTLRVWETVQMKVEKPNSWSPHTLLWSNPQLPHFHSIPDPVLWARYGIMFLSDIVSLTFDDLKKRRNLPNRMLFRYFQLQHDFRDQFSHPLLLEISDVESLLRSADGDKHLSALYSFTLY